MYSIDFFRYYDAISSQPSVTINDLDRSISMIKEYEEQVKMNERTVMILYGYV